MPGNMPLLPVLDFHQTALFSWKLWSINTAMVCGMVMVDRNQQSGQMLIIPCLVKIVCKEYFFKTVDLLLSVLIRMVITVFLIVLHCIFDTLFFLSKCIYIFSYLLPPIFFRLTIFK